MTSKHRTDIATIRRQIDDLPGWTSRLAKRGALLVYSPTGKTCCVHPTPSDTRAWKNSLSDLAHIGFFQAVDDHVNAQERQRRNRIQQARASVTPMPTNKPAPRSRRTTTSTPQTAEPELGGAMQTRTEKVTPTRAEELLNRPMPDYGGTPLRQRRIDDDHVGFFERIIRRGEWQLSPEGVALDNAHGAVLEGQHRLWAIINTGQPQPMRVTYNVPPEVFKSMNTGKKRTTADVLHIEGEISTAQLASAMKLLVLYDNWHAADAEHPGWTRWSRVRITNAEILETLERCPRMREHVRVAHALTSRVQFVVAALAVFRHLALEAWPQGEGKLDEFWDALATGAMLPTGHPALTLRNWAQSSGRLVKPRREAHLLVLLKAWNAFCRGREVRAVRFTTTEDMPEPYRPKTRHAR